MVARVSDHIFPGMFTNLEYLEVSDSDTAPSRPATEDSPAYVNPTGYGKFIGGRGNSGLSFADAPLEAPVSGRPEMSTIAVKFTETGGWDGPADYFPWGPVRYDNGADGVEYFDNIARIAMSEDRFAL